MPPASLTPPDPDLLCATSSKLLSDVNTSLKLLQYQSEPDLVRKKLPQDVMDKLMFYNKKFKVLLRHCYAQMDHGDMGRVKELLEAIKEEGEKF